MTPFEMRWKALFRRESVRAALILVLILNALFFPFIWGHKSMIEGSQLCPSVLPSGAWTGKHVYLRWTKTQDPAAVAWFFEPALAFTGYEYKTEKALPLWNPYQAYGAPFAANMQSQPFFPLTILLSLDLTPRTYNLYMLARLFIAGFFGYLYLRLFLSFISSLAGGIAMMLGGYFVLLMTMPHISVEMLIPAALYTGELLLRSPTYGRFVAFSVVLFLTIAGGMPESTFLLFTLLYPYIFFRVICDEQLRRAWVRLTARVGLASITGICLSAILLLPFLELMRHGFDTHQPRFVGPALSGLQYQPLDAAIFRYLLPLILGPYDPYHLLRNQSGLIVFFLALIAALASCSLRNKGSDARLRTLTFFFFAFAALMILKAYGAGPINSVGELPVLRYIVFVKYGQAEVSVCAGILAAIGLERLIKAEVSKTILAIGLGITFAMVPVAAILGQSLIDSQVVGNKVPAQFTEMAFGVGVCALLGLAMCFVIFGRHGRRLGVSILAVLALEISFNFIPDVYYFRNTVANQSENPYEGAPYIDFLKGKCTHFERITGRDRVLYPDWASVFQLQDIRDLDAMYYWRYLPFVRDFLGPALPLPNRELLDRFTGADREYRLTAPLEKRLLQLSSAKYILSMTPAPAPFKLVYDREVKIYEYDDVLPRAAIYFRAAIARDETDALDKLADPDLNVFQTVIINGTQLEKSQLADIEEMNQGRPKPVAAAGITSYTSQSVEIRAALDQSGLLVLNDSAYPGWEVTVDGAPAKWLSANFLFRGVLLSRGEHVIRFMYRPRTFYLGSAIALGAMICILFPLILRLRAAVMLRMSYRKTSEISTARYTPTA